jgi:hypothetical protein
MITWICCSSKRSDSICQKTLKTLHTAGFTDTITIIVPHDEVATYIPALEQSPVSYVLVGATKGLVEQRKAAREMFPEGAKMVFIDDDIQGIRLRIDNKKPHVRNIHLTCKIFFEALEATHSLMWGVYPMANALFMDDRVSVGSQYIVGAFYGIINDPRLVEPEMDDCEDWARQLPEQAAGRPPLRFNYVGIDTRYFMNSGGIQRDPASRLAIVQALIDKHPSLVKLKHRKNGKPDLQFKRKTHWLAKADPGSLIAQSIPAAQVAALCAPHAPSGQAPQ